MKLNPGVLIVLIALSALSCIAVVGVIVLSAKGIAVPTLLTSIVSGGIGALSAILVPAMKQDAGAINNISVTPQDLASKDSLAKALAKEGL